MAPRTRPTQTTRIPLEHRFPAWGVDVFESHHADDWRMDLTRHDFLKLIFVLQGEGALVLPAGQRTPIARGNLVVVRIQQEHRLEDTPGKPMSLYVVSIKPEILRVAALDQGLLPNGKIDLDELQTGKVESTIRRLLFEQTLDPTLAGARVVGLALRLLTELIRVSDRAHSAPERAPTLVPEMGSDSLSRMRAYVDDLQDHFFEATNLDSAAMGLGLSRRRFTQLFREVTGSSWLNHVRGLRVSHAKHLLAHTDRTVLSIAFECGFEDLSTFYRAFKREVGQSPNQWRSSSRSEVES